MSESTIESRVKNVIAEVLETDVAKLTGEARIREDLGADSMQVVTIIIALDEEFDTEFNTDELPRGPVTIGWITDYVESKICQEI